MTLCQVSACISKPFWWSIEVISELTEPTKSSTDLLFRLTKVALVIIFSPLSISLKGIAEFLLLFHSKPFTYKEGIGSPSNSEKSLSILNWNICGLPGGLPRWFGGVPPLFNRIDKIATLLINKGCDIICLQEAHDVKAQHTLYKKLRNDYKYFYSNIGSKAFQHNSGLFIASKKKLSNESFTSFSYKGKRFGINKGYFSFDVNHGSESSVRVVATHFQPYDSEKDQQLRVKALTDIGLKNPDIVCGDLNIDRLKQEDATAIIYGQYVDALVNNETATDSLNEAKKGKVAQPQGLSIDYCLLQNKSSYAIQTEVIETYNLNDPEVALSDHHAIISTIV